LQENPLPLAFYQNPEDYKDLSREQIVFLIIQHRQEIRLLLVRVRDLEIKLGALVTDRMLARILGRSLD